MKHYRNAAEVLDCLVDFHIRAGELARTVMDRGESEKASLVFDCLYHHHEDLRDRIPVQAEKEMAGVLTTAVDYSLDSDDAPDAFIDSFQLDGGLEFEAAEKLTRALAEYVVGLLENITSEIASPPVTEGFARLLEAELAEQRKLFEAVKYIRQME